MRGPDSPRWSQRLATLSFLLAMSSAPPGSADPRPVGRAEPPSGPAVAVDDTEQGMSAQEVAGWIITAVGGAALVVATVTGSLALNEYQQLAELCPDRQCEPPQHGAVDQFNGFRTVATASVIGAAVAVTGGVALILTAEPSGAAERPGPGARALLDSGTLSLTGTF